ncbi:MAG: ribosomal protein S18-alanine N-acetyltransferase [Erysipelothrix sp.]|jgi:ribosomal-protein-alanine acetyltransferase|nr:ribosomal protein S18-alanine N-acetyltransferase [Erysipelothrix sp.]
MIKSLTSIDIPFVLALEDEYKLSTCVNSQSAKTWILTHEEESIGFITWIESEDNADLLNIAISSDYSNQGYGSVLLSTWLSSLKSQGIKHCFLEVKASNVHAIEFYKKHGFIINRIRKGYYQATQEDAVEMRVDYE